MNKKQLLKQLKKKKEEYSCLSVMINSEIIDFDHKAMIKLEKEIKDLEDKLNG